MALAIAILLIRGAFEIREVPESLKGQVKFYLRNLGADDLAEQL